MSQPEYPCIMLLNNVFSKNDTIFTTLLGEILAQNGQILIFSLRAKLNPRQKFSFCPAPN